MEAALAQLRTEGVLAGDLDLSHLSPALYGHLNPYGKYRFDLDEDLHGAGVALSDAPDDDKVFAVIHGQCQPSRVSRLGRSDTLNGWLTDESVEGGSPPSAKQGVGSHIQVRVIPRIRRVGMKLAPLVRAHFRPRKSSVRGLFRLINGTCVGGLCEGDERNELCPTINLQNHICLRHEDEQIEKIPVDARGMLS